ncbi:MAG: hypothetical protein KDB50_16540 [Mycobacterium sp.]|nr:hypothetical protein [Mycobacterium sp.]
MTYLVMGMLLADEPNRGPDYGKASPVGLLVVLLLLVAVFFLWRSMGRQLKKVPVSFDTPGAATDPPTSSGTDGHGGPDNETTARDTGG